MESIKVTFTRKEVRALLKAQIEKVANSVGRMEINHELSRLSPSLYGEEINRTHKRIKNVTLVKF